MMVKSASSECLLFVIACFSSWPCRCVAESPLLIVAVYVLTLRHSSVCAEMKSRTCKRPANNSGSYPAISPTYWQPSSNPGPYLIPGIVFALSICACVTSVESQLHDSSWTRVRSVSGLSERRSRKRSSRLEETETNSTLHRPRTEC